MPTFVSSVMSKTKLHISIYTHCVKQFTLPITTVRTVYTVISCPSHKTPVVYVHYKIHIQIRLHTTLMTAIASAQPLYNIAINKKLLLIWHRFCKDYCYSDLKDLVSL